VSAVNNLITSHLTAALVDNRQCAIAVHRHPLALAGLDSAQLDILDFSFDAGFMLRRFFQTRRAADVKVRIVSCVPGSPIDWAAITPTASPMSTGRPVARLRP
jgi:hypothetical protein